MIKALMSRMRMDFAVLFFFLFAWLPFNFLHEYWIIFMIAAIYTFLPSLILAINYYLCSISRSNNDTFQGLIISNDVEYSFVKGSNMFSWGYDFEYVKMINKATNEKCFVPFCSVDNFNQIKSRKLSGNSRGAFYPFIWG